MNKINDKYVKETAKMHGINKLSQEDISRVRKVMEKYGDNHWWESNDPIKLATYQLYEPVLLADYSLFFKGLEKLLGRPVLNTEFFLNISDLREEMKLGIKRLKRGIGTSEEYQETAVIRAIESFKRYYEKKGKKVYFLPTD